MRYYISLLLCFTLAASSAQVSDRQIKENMAKLDSQTRELNESMARSTHSIDSIIMVRSNEQMARNMDSFMAERREQDRRRLKQMYWRLGFGVLMMVVLVVGFVRRRKLKQ